MSTTFLRPIYPTCNCFKVTLKPFLDSHGTQPILPPVLSPKAYKCLSVRIRVWLSPETTFTIFSSFLNLVWSN